MDKKHLPWAALAVAVLLPVYALTFRPDPPNPFCEALSDAMSATEGIWAEGASDEERQTLTAVADGANDLALVNGCKPCVPWDIASSSFAAAVAAEAVGNREEMTNYVHVFTKYGRQATARCI